jgi:hypothetical protein
MLKIVFCLSFAAAAAAASTVINDADAMKIIVKLSNAFDIANNFLRYFSNEDKVMIYF